MSVRRWRAGDPESGTIAPLVPILGFILLLLGGLVVDASRQLGARGRAVAYAEEAARAGASAIRRDQAELELDEPEVRARVAEFCAAIRADDTQSGGVTECAFVPPLREVGGGDRRKLVVRVDVKLEIPASLLGIVGVQTLRASGSGRARPFEGVDPRDVDSSPPPVIIQRPESPPPAPPGVEVSTVPLPSPSPSPLPSLLIPSIPALPSFPALSPVPDPATPPPP